jgi:predicted Zn-dependent peptidase
MFKKITLKNGLRIITVPMKNTQAITVLVTVGTGSKYENKKNNGLSHFLEHMFFKGTEKRPTSLEISETLDGIGGIYNAFTGKEITGYWAKSDFKHLDLILDWVSDIFLNSKLEEKEIKREKGVIIEEMKMYLDTPTSYIEDLWEKLLYGDQPAGWFVIGEKNNILSFKKINFLDYIKNHYTSRNTVVCVAGNIESDKVEEKISAYFKNITTGDSKQKIEVMENQKNPQCLVHFKKTDQTHLYLGVRAYNLFHPDKFAQMIMATILGGFMSSRLFISIREKQGLAYYVRTTTEENTDTGYLATKAGIDHGKIEKVIKSILKEYQIIKSKKVEKAELRKAKDNLKGTLALALEPSDMQASYYSSQEILTGRILTPEEQFRKIDSITEEDIQRIANDLFRPENLNLAVIGPFKNKEKLNKLLKL